MTAIGTYQDNPSLAKTCTVCGQPILPGQLCYGAGIGIPARHYPDCMDRPTDLTRIGLDR